MISLKNKISLAKKCHRWRLNTIKSRCVKSLTNHSKRVKKFFDVRCSMEIDKVVVLYFSRGRVRPIEDSLASLLKIYREEFQLRFQLSLEVFGRWIEAWAKALQINCLQIVTFLHLEVWKKKRDTTDDRCASTCDLIY